MHHDSTIITQLWSLDQIVDDCRVFIVLKECKMDLLLVRPIACGA
jgi:hypothetical protein